MDLRPALRAVIRAPKRFLDWVYAPDGRSRPSRGQASLHLHMSGAGHDTSRWMMIEEDERRDRDAAIRRIREANRQDRPGR